MEKEIWKDVIGYEGDYQISNLGRLKSFVIDTIDGRILKSKTSNRGYLCYMLKDRTQVTAHSLVAKAFVPNPHGYREVDHISNIKTDNRATNLAWTKHRENVQKDQSDYILCEHETGKKIIASGTREAAEKTSHWRRSVQYALKNGNKTITGWSFRIVKKYNS
jgi:hypothetical protein